MERDGLRSGRLVLQFLGDALSVGIQGSGPRTRHSFSRLPGLINVRGKAKLDLTRSGYFDFAHIIVVEELVLAVVPFDTHARPVASAYRALIVRAIMPSNALSDLETFGLTWSHCVHCQPTV